MALEFTLTPAEVADRAGLRGPTAIPEATRCLELAKVELEEALSGAFRPVPPEVADEMALRVAVDAARAAKTAGAGGQATQVEDGRQIPAPRDPLASVRPRLARYTVGLA